MLPTVANYMKEKEQQENDVQLTREEVAARWKVHPETVSRRKALKPIEYNERCKRYWLSDVIAYEQQCAA